MNEAELENLRKRLPELDGQPLTVLGYPHKNIGAVIREHLAHIDLPAEGINTGFFRDRLSEIKAALEAEP